MSTFSITVSAGSAEELLSELLTVVNAMSAGAGLALTSKKQEVSPFNKEGDYSDLSAAEADAQYEREQEEKAAKPSGRRGGRKTAEKTPEAEPEAEAAESEEPKEEPKGRRSRGVAKKDDLVNDNEEQAALRAQLIVDLQDLADVEEAHSEVQDALARTGAKSVKEVASASLGDFNEDIQVLIAKYFE